MSGYKVNKDLQRAGHINHFLHWLVVYHFCKPTDNDKNRIVTTALSTMSRYRKQLQVSIVFLGNKSSSFLDAKVPLVIMPTGQLRLDNLRNVRQALVILLTSSQPIKHFHPDPGLRHLLLESISRIDAEVLGLHLRAEVAGKKHVLHK